MDLELTIYRLAAEYDERYPTDDPETVATKAVRQLSAADRKGLLVGWVSVRIDARRRARAHDIEQAALTMATHEGRAAEWETARQTRQTEWREAPWLAHPNTKIYREWVASTDEGQRHEARRLQAAADKAEQDRLFKEDPSEYDRRYGMSALMTEFSKAIEGIRTKAKLELTAELLGSSFALGDGSRVTWGAATLEDHRQRIELLGRNVEGNLQTIVLHETAAALLRQSSASCLADLQTVAA